MPTNSASVGSDKTVYVVDRDLIRFAKFAGAVLGVVIAVGVIFFGVDIKRAVSDAEEAAKAAQKALTEVQGDLQGAKSAEESALQTGKEVARQEKTIEVAREEVQHLLTQVKQDASFIGNARAKKDGAENRPGAEPNGVDVQVELDIEAVGAVAPEATIVVYFAPNTHTGFADAIAAAAADKDNHPTVLSISWGEPESTYTLAALQEMDRVCKTASDQGITILAAAGNNGVTDGQTDKRAHVDFPAADPWVLAVGGTEVTAVGDKIESEIVWNQGDQGGASGGGVSEQFPLPEWQNAVNVPSRADGSRGRGIPDVVANASPLSGYQIFCDGHWTVVGGTSAATPFWAGLVALINQGVGKNVEHLNQLLYKIPDSTGAFRRITKGNNTFDGVQGYSAGPSWSAVAGWGSPDGEKLLEAIKNQLKHS